MTEQVQETLAGADPASATEVTATPDSAPSAPVEAESQPEQQPAAKTFTQEELDAAISKRLAREQRKWEREQQARQAELQASQVAPKGELDRSAFGSDEAYADALAEYKARQLVEARERQKQQEAIRSAYQEREEAARDKYDDFEQVAYNPSVRITETMAEAIQASELGPDLAYWFGSNPKEADRVSRLSPILQAREIGRIEAKLGSNPVVKPTTSAPAPITPVTARTSGNPSYDTTDPRSVKAMSTSEWIEAERARQMRKLQAQMNR